MLQFNMTPQNKFLYLLGSGPCLGHIWNLKLPKCYAGMIRTKCTKEVMQIQKK